MMAENKKSFLLYTDVHFTVQKLTDEQAGKLFKHILSYVNDENPVMNDFVLEIVFEPIKQSLKRDLRKYEDICFKRSQSGKEGGVRSGEVRRNKREANEANALNRSKSKQTKQKQANEADNDSDSDSDNDIKEEVIRRNRKKKPFVPPTLEEVKTYFKENGYTQGAAIKAFNHYAVAGWHDTSGKPVLNWKQKVGTNWFKDENLIRQYEVVPEFLSGPRR